MNPDMQLSEFLTPPAESTQRTGPEDKIVLSSRVRLARNLGEHSFPTWAKKTERVKILESVRPAIEQLPQMVAGFCETMDNLSALDKQILIERHLISREHAAKGQGSGLALSRDEALSIMINEEDHLRMQALLPGLQVQEAWTMINGVDDQLEKSVPYAFSEERGYLTACPTNLGTAMRVSAMLHLPGLALSEHINRIINSVTKLGLAVRGLYGEGTEALGNIFQVSNQMTLGESEETIVERLRKVLNQVIEEEENARGCLLEDKLKTVLNHIGRAYGILSNAHSISSKETMNQLSFLRLGVDFEMFKSLNRPLIDELFMITQPAHLQKQHTDKLGAEERDIHRADLLRKRLKNIDRPTRPKI